MTKDSFVFSVAETSFNSLHCSWTNWHFMQVFVFVWSEGLSANICFGAHWGQRVRLQGVVFSKDEPRSGENRHDSATALPAHGWTARIRGGGTVPRFRCEIKRRDTNTALPSKIRLETAIYGRCCLCVFLFFLLGSKGLLSSLHAPANPRSEASCPGKEGNFWS